MNCEHCPSFNCKLKTDYTRHLKTKAHIDNETISTLMYSLHNLQFNSRWLELEAHKRKFKKVINQFLKKVSFPIHNYNIRNVLVDIRDIFSPSNDREISFCNEYFHNSKY